MLEECRPECQEWHVSHPHIQEFTLNGNRTICSLSYLGYWGENLIYVSTHL